MSAAENPNEPIVSDAVWKYVAMGIGGLLGLILVAGLVYLLYRKCWRRGTPSEETTIEPADAMQSIMQNNRVASVSRYGKKPAAQVSGMTVTKGKNKQQPDYFMDLATKMKVKSISDYKK